MRRTGIDLSSSRCILVDAESSGRRRAADAVTFRVHQYAYISNADNRQALTAELKALAARGEFSKRVWVNLWDVKSSHQYVLLPAAREEVLESMARRHGASSLGMRDPDVTVANTIGRVRTEPGHPPKIEVSFFAAGSQDIKDRLRSIVDAGFLVEGVTTPCGALWAQARLRRPAVPGEVHAHVAIGIGQSAIGIFADGSLLYARDFDWGYTPGTAVDRDAFARRLAADLRRSFLYLKQYWEPEVSQVVLCGDMPELRSLTAPLIERLNVEVETLDTLEGIDTASLPSGFADSAASYRLASAIAVEPPPVNLLPLDIAATRAGQRGWLILTAGSAAAVAFAAFLYAQAGTNQQEAEQQLAIVEKERISRSVPVPNEGQRNVLARIAGAVPPRGADGVTVTSIRLEPGDDAWHVTVNGSVRGSNPSEAGSRFVDVLRRSSLFEGAAQLAVEQRPSDIVQVSATYVVRQ